MSALSQACDPPVRLRRALTYWQRLRGLLFRTPLNAGEGIWIAPCNGVHTFGMGYAIDVVYLDASFNVIKIAAHVQPWRMSMCGGAASVVELASGGAQRLGVKVGQVWSVASSEGITPAPPPAGVALAGRRSQRGASAIEMAVMMPAALFALLLVAQTALVFHAKGQANVAAQSAARMGSMDHARESAIREGIARGLVPFMGGGSSGSEIASTLLLATAQAALADVEILSPNREAFDDYPSELAAQRLRDEGMTVDAPVIQNMNIAGLRCPWVAAGASATCSSDLASNASGQSLQDANLLKVRITWGIPASKQVPLAGPVFSQAIRGLAALGLLDYAPRTLALVNSQGVIPVTVTATVRMQTEPIRNDTMVARNRSAPAITQRASGVYTALAAAPAASALSSAPAPVEPRPTTDANGNPLPTTPTEPVGNANPPPNPFPNGVPPAPPPAAPAPAPAPVPPPQPAPAPPAVCPASQPNCNTPLPATCSTGTIIETGASDVVFNFDSATINAAGREMLDRVIANARDETFERLVVTGFTDQIGDDAYNQRLSEQRANAVRQYLLDNGLRGRNIVAVGRGENDPVVALSSCPAGAGQIACLAPNRRVVFTFEGVPQ